MAWHQAGQALEICSDARQVGDVLSVLPINPHWQLLLLPRESSTDNESGWTEGHGYGGTPISSPFLGDSGNQGR